jgi:heme-degrading monooxygenase HmoA
MYARVVTIKARHERIEECIRIFKEVNGPSIARQPGFEHGHWWADRDSGEAVSVTFWDTAEHEQASRANIPALITGMAHVLASPDVTQRTYERVHDQQPVGH